MWTTLCASDGNTPGVRGFGAEHRRPAGGRRSSPTCRCVTTPGAGGARSSSSGTAPAGPAVGRNAPPGTPAAGPRTCCGTHAASGSSLVATIDARWNRATAADLAPSCEIALPTSGPVPTRTRHRANYTRQGRPNMDRLGAPAPQMPSSSGTSPGARRRVDTADAVPRLGHPLSRGTRNRWQPLRHPHPRRHARPGRHRPGHVRAATRPRRHGRMGQRVESHDVGARTGRGPSRCALRGGKAPMPADRQVSRLHA